MRVVLASLYAQVLIGIVLGVCVGIANPAFAEQLKPLGDLFIRMIKMVIGLVIFCTIVPGIAGMGDVKKVGRIGGKALLYFEIVSTIALLLGWGMAHLIRPGAGFNADPATLDAASVASYAGSTHMPGIGAFLQSIVPGTIVEAFARGDILPVVFVSLLFGFALSRMGARDVQVRETIEAFGHLIFSVINILMRFAPIGAFGAMAYTIGKFGLSSLGQLMGLVLTLYATGAIFVVCVLGLICALAGFNIFRLLAYLKEELLITLGASSSDAALPSLMEKLENLGCSRPLVGLVVPTGYIFNPDGTSIYMTLTALFIAQAMNIDLTLGQEVAIFATALLTSKGASGITGAGFIALVGTLSVVPAIPLAGMALILGVDRFMSEGRAIVNIIGNSVATVVLAAMEGELDRERMRTVLASGRTKSMRIAEPDTEPAIPPHQA